MADNSYSAQFERILRAHLFFLEADTVLAPDLALFELGLDSLSLVALLVELEEELGIAFPEDLAVYEVFSSVGGLWAAVKALRGEVGTR